MLSIFRFAFYQKKKKKKKKEGKKERKKEKKNIQSENYCGEQLVNS